MRQALIAGMVAAALAVTASETSAAVRYAEPGGDGPASSCPKANPCNLVAALEDPSVVSGDEVVVLPGTYDVGSEALEVIGISVHGFRGSRPLIESSAPGYTLFAPVANVSDLELVNGGGGPALIAIGSTTVDRIIARSSDDFQLACQVPIEPGYIRDSICVNGGGGPAAGARITGAGTNEFQLRNLTAFATGSGANSFGILFFAGADLSMDVEARNVIAEGGNAVDVHAVEGTGETDVEFDFSNYASFSTEGGATITPSGTGSNQIETPLFVDVAGLDFHQLPASPTRNAGTVDALGPFDVDRQPRVQEGAPDIGADEFDDRLRLKVRAKKRQKARKLRVRVQCPEEECSVVAKGTTSAGGDRFKLKPKRKFLAAADKRKLRLKAKNIDRLEDLVAAGDGRAKIKVRGTDPGGVSKKKKVAVELVG